MSTATLFFLGAQLIAAGLVGVAAGNLVGRWLGWDEDLGGPERALIAIGGTVAFAVVCMVGNIVTGGAVFGVPGLVPVLAAILVYLGRAGARLRLPASRHDRVAMALAIVILGALYVVPVLVAGSGVRTGDPPWHLGWTQQLLGGEAVPNGPAPGYGRNAYPWGWHALLATLVRLVPGSDPLIAHETVHVLLVAAIPLGAACLARRVRPNAGWAAAGSASLVGGLGWIAAQGRPAFDPSPRNAHFGADLVVASPNSVYESFPPALPRELGLVLLAVAALLLMRALARPERRGAMAVGVALGLVGLVSVPMFVCGVAWTLAAVLVTRRDVMRTLIPLGLGMLVTFGLWAGPVVANYFRFGGFVNITPSLGKEWPLVQALSSWGILLPLAIVGIVATWRAAPGGRAVLAFAAASIVLVGFSLLRGAFDWNLAGNATLLHQGRTWPPAHMVGAALAGIGAMWAWDRVRYRSRFLAGLGATAVVMLGSASPLLAAEAMTDLLVERRAGFIYSAPRFQRAGYVRAAADHLDPDDIVAAYDHEVAFNLFEFSGARLADYDHKRLGFNDVRIRYKDLAAGWEANKPFCASHSLMTLDQVTPRLSSYALHDPGLQDHGLVLVRYPEPACG